MANSANTTPTAWRNWPGGWSIDAQSRSGWVIQHVSRWDVLCFPIPLVCHIHRRADRRPIVEPGGGVQRQVDAAVRDSYPGAEKIVPVRSVDRNTAVDIHNVRHVWHHPALAVGDAAHGLGLNLGVDREVASGRLHAVATGRDRRI